MTAFTCTEHQADLFWSNADKGPGHGPHGDCWLWRRSRNGKYGQVNLGGRIMLAHRASFAIANGFMPPSSLDVCHSCHVTICVNPAHLHVGTRRENEQEKKEAGRTLCGERAFHAKFTQQQVDEFRREWVSTPISARQLAIRTGVSPGVMREIVKNLTYFDPNFDPNYNPPPKDARRNRS